jgi:Fe-S oxidoreductase
MMISYGAESGLGQKKQLLEVNFDVGITCVSCRYCVSDLSVDPATKRKRPDGSVEPPGRKIIKSI